MSFVDNDGTEISNVPKPGPGDKRRLLLVEDDVSACVAICSFLANEFEMLVRHDGTGFEEAVEEFSPQGILLDLNLPRRNGLKLLQAIQGKLDKIKVFVISVRGSEEDVLRSFALGAVDYLTKPFSLKVMKARIDRWLQEEKSSFERFKIDAALIDLPRAVVERDGEKLPLTKKEVLVLRCLIANSGIVVSREKLLDFAWGYDYSGTSRTVDNVISAVRQKISATPDENEIIVSHRGLGYSLSKDFVEL